MSFGNAKRDHTFAAQPSSSVLPQRGRKDRRFFASRSSTTVDPSSSNISSKRHANQREIRGNGSFRSPSNTLRDNNSKVLHTTRSLTSSTQNNRGTAMNREASAHAFMPHARMPSMDRRIADVDNLVHLNQCREVLFERAKRPVRVIKEGWFAKRNAWLSKDERRYFMITRTELIYFTKEPEAKGHISTSGEHKPHAHIPVLLPRPLPSDVIPLRSVVRAFRVARGETEAGGFEKFNDGHFIILELPSKAVILRADTIKDAQDLARLLKVHAELLRQPKSLSPYSPPLTHSETQEEPVHDESRILLPTDNSIPHSVSPLSKSDAIEPKKDAWTTDSLNTPPKNISSVFASITPQPIKSTSKRRTFAKASHFGMKELDKSKQTAHARLKREQADVETLEQMEVKMKKQTSKAEASNSRTTKNSAIAAFYEGATLCSLCHEVFRFNRTKHPCGKCASPCCTQCLAYDIDWNAVCCICYAEHVDSIACSGSNRKSSGTEKHQLAAQDPNGDFMYENDSDVDADEEFNVLNHYATLVNLGAPVQSVIRSMKQNEVPSKYAGSFAKQYGNDATVVFNESYGDLKSYGKRKEAGYRDLNDAVASNRETITVQIEAKFRSGVSLGGSLFDFSSEGEMKKDLMPTEIADVKKIFRSTEKTRGLENNRMNGSERSTNSDREITLLNVQRAQNVAIVLSRFKCKSFPDLAELLFAFGDLADEKVDVTSAQILMTTFPSTEEKQIIMSYSGNLSQLRIAEQWMSLLCSSKAEDPFDKINAFVIVKTILQRLSAVLDDCTSISAACTQVMTSKRLQRIVEAALQLCNVLNENTKFGNADALSLASLLKLASIRATSGHKSNERPTILQYLVKLMCERGEQHVCHLTEEMPEIALAGKIEEQHLLRQSQELAEELERLQSLIICEERHHPILGNSDDIECASFNHSKGINVTHVHKEGDPYMNCKNDAKQNHSRDESYTSIFFRSQNSRKVWLVKMRETFNTAAVALLAVQSAVDQMTQAYRKLFAYCCEEIVANEQSILQKIGKFVINIEKEHHLIKYKMNPLEFSRPMPLQR